MANLIINEQDAERIQEFARQENRTVEEVVSRMVEKYAKDEEYDPEISLKNYRAKLYKMARKYWEEVNDRERLSLTDEQLDEQFWCIDPEGIPRLKSDQDKIKLPPNGLLRLLEAVWEANPTGEVDEPIDYREILNKDFPDYLMRRMQGDSDQTSTD